MRRSRTALALPGLFLASAFLAPAPAPAATVTKACAVKGCMALGVQVTARPGEANRIRVTATRAGAEVTDAGAPLEAGAGCRATAAGAVRCEDVFAVFVSAGDGDDVVDADTGGDLGYATLDGGRGDDILTGGQTPDTLLGGGGRDRLSGGPSRDFLSDGDSPAAPDGDVMDGGEGCDVVDYSARRGRVVVRLDAAGASSDAGEAGEGDVLTGMDGAYGGRGDDALRASDAGAVSSDGESGGLVGGPGDDLLIGGAGRDEIDASTGDDRVRAGRGNDDVVLSYAKAQRGARVDCGPGFDYVGFAGPRDVLAGCDTIETEESFGTFIPTTLARGAVRLATFENAVAVVVRVDGGRLAGRAVARRTFRSRGGRLRLTRLGRRLARRRARPPLRVEIRAGRSRSGFRL